MEETKPKIKPLFARSITLQNLSKYQDLIKRRYKTTLNFRFTCPEKPSYYAPVDDKITQKKAFKALKFLKVIKKADLSGLNIHVHLISPIRTLALFKRISKVKSLSVLNKRTSSNLYKTFSEEWLRYLPALRHLNYELAAESYASREVLEKTKTARERDHPLEDIKYCPKIQSLKVKVPNYATPFFKAIYDFKQYPATIKRLSISPEFTLPEDPNSSIECLKNLQSLQMKFNQASCPSFIVRNMNSLAKLENLQELGLQFSKQMIPDVYTAFGKISERGILKKLKLNFGSDVPKFEGVLKAFKGCQLTHFSLRARTSEEKMLEPIAKFLKDRTELEGLKIHIIHEYLFNSKDVFEEICKQINKLPALRKLSINFHTAGKPNKKTDPTALVSYLQPTLTKPIKLEALSLKCNQVDSSEEFQGIMTGLQGLTGSLHKFKVDLGAYFPNKQAHDGIISFIESLENIRVLKLLSLEIGAQKFLNDLVETVYGFKYLRVLIVGNIKGTVSKPVFLDAVEAIVKKRGLVQFDCNIAIDFMMTLRKKSKTAPRVDKKKVQKINPALEIIPSVLFIFDHDLFDRSW